MMLLVALHTAADAPLPGAGRMTPVLPPLRGRSVASWASRVGAARRPGQKSPIRPVRHRSNSSSNDSSSQLSSGQANAFSIVPSTEKCFALSNS